MSKRIIGKLRDLSLPESDIVTNDMLFEYRSRPCHYMEERDQWATRYSGAYYNYLYLIEDGKEKTPPAGMRSAVPLGGLGTGSVELRADGTIMDWNIFNNSPAGGYKIPGGEIPFYARIGYKDKPPVMKALGTHPPRYTPGVESIAYAGAFPVSRLDFADPELPVDLSLYAYSRFKIYDQEASGVPGITFSFTAENPGNEEVDLSLMFVMPNHIHGEYGSDGDRLTLFKLGEASDAGEMIIGVDGDFDTVSRVQSDVLSGIQRNFCSRGEFPPSMSLAQEKNPIDGAVGGLYDTQRQKEYGALTVRMTLKPGETKNINFIMAWRFPHRSHAGEILGNHYANLFANCGEVVRSARENRGAVLDEIHTWHSLCRNNSLPPLLQEGLLNSAATMVKTGMWFSDGRWRQWESFSCPGVDPIHILFYRVLPFVWFFTDLHRSQLRGFADTQREDGYIEENLGRATHRLDEPHGRMIGDSCTTFILDVYMDYLWTGDRESLDDMKEAVTKAALWQVTRSEEFGLPRHLQNSYDWWTYREKELCSYNAILHLAALSAAEKMGAVWGETELVDNCRKVRIDGGRVLEEVFWNGESYDAWRDKGKGEGTLMSDTLYGQLWAGLLDLAPTVSSERIRSHLISEKRTNGTPYGLKVMETPGRGNDAVVDHVHKPGAEDLSLGHGEATRDNIVWEAGSLDWCALNIMSGGSLDDSLAEADIILDKWINGLKDQWDIRDLTADWNGEPYCNSHYSRQVIMWAIPLALSGQKYSALDRVLSFDIKGGVDIKMPFMIPGACGFLEVKGDRSYCLTLIAGRLEIGTLMINGKRVSKDVCLHEPGDGKNGTV